MESFILYTAHYEIVEDLTDEQLGKLSRALYLYARDGTEMEMEPIVKMAYSFIKGYIQKNAEKYQKKCERNRENIRKRWTDTEEKDTTEYDRIRPNTTEYGRKNGNTTENGGNTSEKVVIHNENDKLISNSNNREISNKISFSEDKASEPPTRTREKPDEEIDSLGKSKTKGNPGSEKSEEYPYQTIMAYWNKRIADTHGAMRPITRMTDNRKTMVRARLRNCRGDTLKLLRVIDLATESDFMNGDNRRGWLGNFDWIFGNEQNFTKVLEGEYTDPKTAPKLNDKSYDRLQERRGAAAPAHTAEEYRRQSSWDACK